MEPLAHSIEDAAERIGVGRTLMYQLIREKRVEVVRIGRRTLVPEASLKTLLDELRREPA